MKKILIIIAGLFLIAGLFTQCHTMEISSGRAAKSQKAPESNEWYLSYALSIVEKDAPIGGTNAKCPGGVARVKMEQSPINSLVNYFVGACVSFNTNEIYCAK